MTAATANWTLVNHIENNGNGILTTITPDSSGKSFSVTNLTDDHASNKIHAPWFIGLAEDGKVIMYDPAEKVISKQAKMPLDAFPIYSYKDPDSDLIWFTFDGDKKHGNDELNCGTNGSTVTIIDRSTLSHVKTLCLGRGHHVVTFLKPTANHPDMPKIVYVSNLLDGSISVIDYDQNNTDTYLTVISEINLCEPEKEKDNSGNVPNNAFPHGKQYSDLTGKIYSLNNGYGTVAVIEPKTQEIVSRIDLKGASNLLLSPCGKYIIGKGADRKSNDAHVLGCLSVIDIDKETVETEVEIKDLYPSTYRFNPAGTRLYVTSAATGKGEQKNNLEIDTLTVFDAKTLPELSLIAKVKIGKSDCGRRPIAFPTDASVNLVFLPNPSDGTVSIIDSTDNSVIDTLKISSGPGNEFNFSFWKDDITGA
ncbi:MAG: YncE family protein [Gammaproteobacteria bacterium]|nr:YncE family protein [Gammaproteobacteria bacterium]